jgi:photosystem II stability/assembly factor-like uncharacterized protein
MKHRNVYAATLIMFFALPVKNIADKTNDNTRPELKDLITNPANANSAPFLSGLQGRNRSSWLGGAVNVVFKSTDGGQTWLDIGEGLPENLEPNDFLASDGGLYLRTGNGIYYRNPGSTFAFWKKDAFPLDHSSLASGKRGLYAFNYDGQFSQRIKGTSVWSPTFTNFPEKWVNAVFESDEGAVFVSCGKGLFKSANGGKTWKQVHARGWVMKLVESHGVLMATSEKGIIRSTDGGENWDLVMSEGGVGISVEVINGGFAAIAYNSLLQARRVRVSYDGGENWQAIDDGLPADASIASIVQLGDYFFCGHPDGIFRSSDKGKTWKLLFPSIENKVFNLSVSGNVIYAIRKVGGC